MVMGIQDIKVAHFPIETENMILKFEVSILLCANTKTNKQERNSSLIWYDNLDCQSDRI